MLLKIRSSRLQVALLSVAHILFVIPTAGIQAEDAPVRFEQDVRPVLNDRCVKCHGGDKVKGKVNFAKIETIADADRNFDLWETVAEVLEEDEMPPKNRGGEQTPLSDAEKETILSWIRARSDAKIQALPGRFQPRRLSGPEYRNTLRSLFGFDLTVGIVEAQQTVAGEKSLVLKLLPTDPPGASGFVNDTHGAPLSTLIWNQYLHLADTALEKLFSRQGRKQLGGFFGTTLPEDWKPEDLTPSQAETLIRRFVPLAFRRPVTTDQLSKMLAGIEGQKGKALVERTKFEMKAVLMSPAFLYRGLLMEGEPGKQQPVDAFELAERLSYFLWEDRPDEALTKAAADGSLSDPKVLAAQVTRMLATPASRSLAESFGVQWLGLNSLDGLLRADPIRLYALKNQPIDFLDYLFTENRPVMEFIDSKTTFANASTAGFYGKDRAQMKRFVKPKGIERTTTPNQRLTLEHSVERGGILTMPSILTMNRGPILRGTWMLRKILGEKLGEPPADIPPIKPSPRGQNLTFRQRFERHRADASCARCHDKIDPHGFALEAYDANGKFAFAVNTQSKSKSKSKSRSRGSTAPRSTPRASSQAVKALTTLRI